MGEPMYGLFLSHLILAFEACSARPAYKVLRWTLAGYSGLVVQRLSCGKYIILCESRAQYGWYHHDDVMQISMLNFQNLAGGKEFHNSKIESHRLLYNGSGAFSFLYMSKKLVKLWELEFIAGMQLEWSNPS